MSGQSAAYWVTRIAADEARAQALAKKTTKYLRRAYQREYRMVLAKMERLYAQASQDGLDTLTRSQLWNYSHWKGLEEQLRGFATKQPAISIEQITKCLDDAFLIGIGQPQAAIGANRTVLMSSWNARAVIDSAWSGASFSSRVWKNTQAVAERIRQDMEDVMIQGKGIGRMKETLMQDFGVAYSDAARLVDTEVSYVFNQGTIMRLKADGYERVMWTTGQRDGKECEICKGRDKQVYAMDNRPRMPAHPRCRCRWVPVIRDRDVQKPTTDPTDEVTKG